MSRPIDTILIIDCGSQFTQLIARRVREQHVYSIIRPPTLPYDDFTAIAPKGVIISGSHFSVHDTHAPQIPAFVMEAGVPILGICYGQQWLCQHFGGVIKQSTAREFGRAQITVTKSSPLFQGVWSCHDKADVWMSHGDTILTLPSPIKSLAQSDAIPNAIFAWDERKIYGVQFHPEVVHTPQGSALLRQFVRGIAQCAPTWTEEHIVDALTHRIKEQVGHEKVLCALSGGVDSAVTAALLHRAIGNNLTCLFIDNGLLREGEGENIMALAQAHIPCETIQLNKQQTFLSKLKGVTDPEEKRRVIGHTFIECFTEATASLKTPIPFLAQGTLYPDVIESTQTAHAKPIKSHHNVGGLPDHMAMTLVEPLRSLFKDEVRLIGKTLGLPDAFLKRHPFPGPGLAVRIPGAITKKKLDILRHADRLYRDELKKAGLYDAIWQAFAVLLPVRSVGVMGDKRSYDYALSLRAITSQDGMTASVYPFDIDVLGTIATRIVNNVEGVNRVLYDITSKPPATIEWE
ncbi:MAG: glutamine-hydrolyzing GMP synthase [Alphaproteobacteria bacterium GM7ARS4]|nr:glutamine-hydrolyzing GMP synthase [Alphaproteobacteria bacterium GM7ARS4]